MRMMRERVDARMARIEDPLEQITNGVHEFLEFFAEHPGFVELLIQERALFRDRTRPTFIEHREMNLERWRAFYRDLISQGRMRDIPVDRITDVFGSLLYGTIFMNYFSGSTKSRWRSGQRYYRRRISRNFVGKRVETFCAADCNRLESELNRACQDPLQIGERRT